MDQAVGHPVRAPHPSAKASIGPHQAALVHQAVPRHTLSRPTPLGPPPPSYIHNSRPRPEVAQLDNASRRGNPGASFPKPTERGRGPCPGVYGHEQHPVGPPPSTGGVFSFASGRSAPKTALSAERLKELFGEDLYVGADVPSVPALLPINAAQLHADGVCAGAWGGAALGPQPPSISPSPCLAACLGPERERGGGSVLAGVNPQMERSHREPDPDPSGMVAVTAGVIPPVRANPEDMRPPDAGARLAVQPDTSSIRVLGSNLAALEQPAARVAEAEEVFPNVVPIADQTRESSIGSSPAVHPRPEHSKPKNPRPGYGRGEQARSSNGSRAVPAFKSVVPVDRGQPLPWRVSGVGTKMARGGLAERGSSRLPPLKRVCKERLQSLRAEIMADATGVNDSELLAETAPRKPAVSGMGACFQKANAPQPHFVTVPGHGHSSFPTSVPVPLHGRPSSHLHPDSRFSPRPPGSASLHPAAAQEPQPDHMAPIVPPEPAWQLGPSQLGVFANCTSESQSGEGLALALDAVEGMGRTSAEGPVVPASKHVCVRAAQTGVSRADQCDPSDDPRSGDGIVALPPHQQPQLFYPNGGSYAAAEPWRPTEEGTLSRENLGENCDISCIASQRLVSDTSAAATEEGFERDGTGWPLDSTRPCDIVSGQRFLEPACGLATGEENTTSPRKTGHAG
jgi:hypothetical protein